jgi:hypothetical protein
MNKDGGQSGCDLKERCGFYCNFLHGEANLWKTMKERYCDGYEYPLCARRIYFSQMGECAPLDMTPVGTLSKDLLEKLFQMG